MGTKHAGLPGRPALHWRDFLAAINLSICRSIYAAIYLSIYQVFAFLLQMTTASGKVCKHGNP